MRRIGRALRKSRQNWQASHRSRYSSPHYTLVVMKVIVTGGSGLLGRSVVKRFNDNGHSVLGLSLTRNGDGLQKIDLRDEHKVKDLIIGFRPDILIHCAAERRPDVAEKDPKGVAELNVRVTEHLAELSSQLDFKLIYICTDYIFDGNAPEGGYDVDATANPTNLYGKTKLAGEEALLKKGQPGKFTSLRVPVLYGEAERNDESAINVLVDGVKKASEGEKVKMDDWATRFPTLVDDVARVLEEISTYKQDLPPLLNFSSQTQYTKYSISLVFARLLNLNEAQISNLIPISDPPKPGETIRPRDCRLSNCMIASLGIEVDITDFTEWWKKYLKVVD
ncbi:hypothetical protein O181_069872 [Austropuccinia psidii MF-1]|uniref:RmlD-like substrate binding domain-containing protein n=1 Tax=Austropuccinia psidii MF-1 TaxID=1389203 RepID=A0A9Q3I7Q0_9BASI|nr:hypothetical protein [Austropuccinia psidii MF-1]